MIVLFNRITGKVTGFNREPLPLESSHDFKGTPKAKKVITVFVGNVHKTNELGQLLYLNNEGVETTEQFVVVPPVYADKVEVQQDVDGDGIDETVTYNGELISEGYTIDNVPVLVDKYEDVEVTFEEKPLEFTFDELKEAPVEYSKEQLAEMEREQLLTVVAELYETNLILQEENRNTLMAVAELYELMLGGTSIE